MNFTRQTHNLLSANRQGWHVLTVAEAGFSMQDQKPQPKLAPSTHYKVG